MTDIDTMPAGRKMDTLVAEKVMGWVRDDRGFWFDSEDPAMVTTYEDWKPSEEIESAWEVLEKMHEIGGRARMEFIGDTCNSQFWLLSSGDAAFIICRAALRAVEAKQ